MGVFNSKTKRPSSDTASIQNPRPSRELDLFGEMSPYDRNMIHSLKKDFDQDISRFILNHMLMSVMFFENYEHEVWQKSKTTSKFEQDLNATLLKKSTKRCFMPDTGFHNVNKHVRFTPKHGAKKDKSEPLVAQRMYIIHDNIEAVVQKEPVYNGIDKPTIKTRIEDSKHDGYVKLRTLNQSGSLSMESLDSVDSVVAEENTNTSNKKEQAKSSERENEYDYSRISELRIPKPLDIEVTNLISTGRSSDLPNSCITALKVKNIPLNDENFTQTEEDSSESEDVDEEKEENFMDRMRREHKKIDERKRKESEEFKLYKVVYYVNSVEFMRHFQNHVFPNSLATILGFAQEEILQAKSLSGVIYLNVQNQNQDWVHYEIIPAISTEKPGKLPGEWFARDAPEKRDGTTIYKFPLPKMKQEAGAMESLLVPKGFVPKRGQNVESCIEWELDYPHVQKYLTSNLTQAQTRAYLFLVVIFKAFVEPKTEKQGLLVDHLRILMYHELERNFRDWPDHRLGDKLLLVLKNLENCLSRKTLPDYFTKPKNVFDNIPSRFLICAQKQIHDIVESPLLYFLSALRNLTYNQSGEFYPYPDFKKLYQLVTDKSGLVLSPQLEQALKQQAHRDQHKKRYNPQERWQMQQINQRRKKNKLNQKAQQEENQQQRKESVDSINLDFNAEEAKNHLKKAAILKFFIEHFMEIAMASKMLSTMKQVLRYLKYAWYLTKLLQEIASYEEDVKKYQEVIAKEEASCSRRSIMKIDFSPPTTPKRNSTVFGGEQKVGSINLKPSILAQSESSINNHILSRAYEKKEKKRVQIMTADSD